MILFETVPLEKYIISAAEPDQAIGIVHEALGRLKMIALFLINLHTCFLLPLSVCCLPLLIIKL